MKALVVQKEFPLNVTAGGSFSSFNLNTRNWALLKSRVEIESFSRSVVYVKFPKADGTWNRDYTIRYLLQTTSDISGAPVAIIEDYQTTKLTGRLSTSGDSFVGLPVNTYKMADFCKNPSDVYGSFWVESSINPYIALGTQYWTQENIYFVLNPLWRTPVISNIAVDGTDGRYPITITWDVTIQDLADIEIYQGGVLKTTLTATTNKSVVMPANTVGVGEFTVKVIAANNPIEDLGTTGNAQANFTAVLTAPTVDNLAINQTDIRLPVIVSWTSTNQTDYIVEFLQGGTVKATLTGGTAKSATLNANSIPAGATIVRVTVRNTAGGTSVVATKELSFTATSSAPTIAGLEPDGINQNGNLQINVSWTSTNQETWKLELFLDTVLVKTYTGTTEKAFIIPKDTFTSGNVRMKLTLSNTLNGTIATTTREANFFVYAKPPVPVFSPQTLYNQARPTFTWTSSEQVSYQFIITSVVDTGEVVSADKFFQPATNLANNQDYIIKVRVKNQFNLWSDYAEKTITISFTELPKPNFELTIDGSGILVTILYAENPDLANLEIWRKSEFETDFKRMAFNLAYNSQWLDKTVASGILYEYKVIANSVGGGATESDIKSAKTYVEAFEFVNIEDTTKQIMMKWNPLVSISNIRDIVTSQFAGTKALKIERGAASYSVVRMTFDLPTYKDYLEFKQLVETSTVILLRDRRGNKFYGNVTSDTTLGYLKSDWVTISFDFSEVDFIEEDIYSEQRLVLTYFNGRYKFDGTITFSGVHLE